MDYAYTIHGWLKGVNSEKIDRTQEIGKDSYSLQHKNVAQDAFGYSLNYYNNDYNALGSNRLSNTSSSGLETQPVPGGIVNPNLYNGNINRMVTSLLDTQEEQLSTLSNRYQYDQLNRIKSMNAQELTGNSVSNTYASTYSFDKDGNLSTLSRKQHQQQTFDNFKYIYNLGNNQLDYVDKLAADNILQNDIKRGKASQNYKYDDIGQLVRDEQEGIDIFWRVDGKVSQIKKDSGITISFNYDPLGNRLSKTVDKRVEEQGITKTFYIRDASGNVMATYDMQIDAHNEQENLVTLNKKESHIYGSSRLGVENGTMQIAKDYVSNLVAKSASNQSSTACNVGGVAYVFGKGGANKTAAFTENEAAT